MSSDLLVHIEQHLGTAHAGWTGSTGGLNLPFQILLFKDQPCVSSSTYVTVGLSNVLLASLRRQTRQELIMCGYERFTSFDPHGILFAVGNEVRRTGKALLRGAVLGPAGPLFEGSTLSALYVSHPVYFDPSFHEFEGVEPNVGFVWLIPIFREEADFVAANGWQAFEDAVEKSDPDLLDFAREPFL